MTDDKLEPDNLPGAMLDDLWCMFADGPTWDGNIPSKSGRDDLCERGLAARHDGWNFLTKTGMALALNLGLGARKEKRDRGRMMIERDRRKTAAMHALAFRSLMIGVRALTDPAQPRDVESWMTELGEAMTQTFWPREEASQVNEPGSVTVEDENQHDPGHAEAS